MACSAIIRQRRRFIRDQTGNPFSHSPRKRPRTFSNLATINGRKHEIHSDLNQQSRDNSLSLLSWQQAVVGAHRSVLHCTDAAEPRPRTPGFCCSGRWDSFHHGGGIGLRALPTLRAVCHSARSEPDGPRAASDFGDNGGRADLVRRRCATPSISETWREKRPRSRFHFLLDTGLAQIRFS